MGENEEKALANQFAMFLASMAGEIASKAKEEPERRRRKEREILAEWETEAGYSAIVLDNCNGSGGLLCGYVMVPKGHPYHGTYYNELYGKIETKANLSYTREGLDDCWVIGFDCGTRSSLEALKEAAEEVALSLAQATKQLP